MRSLRVRAVATILGTHGWIGFTARFRLHPHFDQPCALFLIQRLPDAPNRAQKVRGCIKEIKRLFARKHRTKP